MNSIVVVLLVLAMLSVVASLFLGLFFMARGRAEDAASSNRMMRLRVTLQGVAVALFIIAMLTQG